MLLRRVILQNVRSFLDSAELRLDGQVSIIIGPNGGGKTNLLDAVVTTLRRYLLNRVYAAHAPTPDNSENFEFRQNDSLNQMTLERHSSGANINQVIEIELEVTHTDLSIMKDMKSNSSELTSLASKKYANVGGILSKTPNWNAALLAAGQRLTYRLVNGSLTHDGSPAAALYQDFLSKFEVDSLLRDEFGLAPLRKPLLYFPVTRTAQGFSSRIALAGYQVWEQRRQNEAANSRVPNNAIIAEAIGSIALRFRLLQEKDNVSAKQAFKLEPGLMELDKVLNDLGYSWNLETISAQRNEYDICLTKQGSSFLVGAASSGERELLTYLFAIYALNIRDALIMVDEPELHLHPKWQTVLLNMFVRLAETTGNQFLMATHSPRFVSPESIQYVSRVYSRQQKSHIVRLQPKTLPDPRHLFNCVNSQNNERIFFADAVILVEGLSDRMVFEELLRRRSKETAIRSIIEVVSVGGKGMFNSYQRLLNASEVRHYVVADLDYIEQVGSDDLKALFTTDNSEIKTDVLNNPKSLDGDAIVRAIDHALASGSWDEARDIWEFIKSRRRRLIADVDAQSSAKLKVFLDDCAKDRLFILSRGAVESYLPVGYRGKRIDKLVELLAMPDLIQRLPAEASELHKIVDQVVHEVEDSAGVVGITDPIANAQANTGIPNSQALGSDAVSP